MSANLIPIVSDSSVFLLSKRVCILPIWAVELLTGSAGKKPANFRVFRYWLGHINPRFFLGGGDVNPVRTQTSVFFFFKKKTCLARFSLSLFFLSSYYTNMSQPRRSFSKGPMTGTDAQIEAVDELREHFKLSTEELIQFRDALRREMDIGLKSEDSQMAMLPSWVFKHPTGQETGEYLGLEISGMIKLTMLCVETKY
jgi:hypothetical protein